MAYNIHYGRTVRTRYMRPRYYNLLTNADRYIHNLLPGVHKVGAYATYHVYSKGNGLLVYKIADDGGLRVQMCRQ